MNIRQIRQELKKAANPEKAKILARFFKTGKEEYGEGDVFWGLTVPQQRKIAQKYTDFNLKQTINLLKSKVHEQRLTALLILITKYQKTEPKLKKQIYQLYLQNTASINNWDLVDLSAPKIVGDYLLDKPQQRKVLYQLARSANLWQRRIAILSTFTFLKNHQFQDNLKISQILLNDQHDLIHKAVGWMLRELGKIDLQKEETFLQKHAHIMPRTMLRYAIEKFSPSKRSFYLRK